MKISQLVVSLLVLALGGALCYFSAEQQQVMDVLVQTHGGGSQIAQADATGLRALNKELEGEAAKVSGDRSTAINGTESARVEMNDQKAKCADALAALKAKQDEKKQLEAEIEKQKALTADTGWVAVSTTAAHGLSELDSIIEDMSSETPDYDSAVEKMGTTYKAQAEEAETLAKALTKSTAAKDAAQTELTKQKAELARLNDINERFCQEYRKNGREYTITGVDGGWRYITFEAEGDSGIIRNDVLLIVRGNTVIAPVKIAAVKGNQITAEVDLELMTPGLHPSTGDRVVRLKPLGN